MNMAQANGGATVEAADELGKAMEAAFARIEAVHANGTHTFIDSLSAEQWASWDVSDEMALVADFGGIDAVDPMDVFDDLPSAA